MGLAASQARFLGITARKMDCEFKSMQIAQEKLSITRQMEKAAQKYQNSLEATKLVWDTGADDVFDLSYDVMMEPSALNEWDPYLITDTQGKIVLSDVMFNAAVASGIIDAKTGDPIGKALFTSGLDSQSTNDGSRHAFLYQLGAVNKISSSTIDQIEKLKENGYTKSGVGGDILDKTLACSMNINSLINYMKDSVTKDKDGNEISVYAIDIINILKNDEGIEGEINDGNKKEFDDKKNKITITKDGNALTEKQLEQLTIADLLSGKYEMTGNMSLELFQKNVNSVFKAIAQKLGYKAEQGKLVGLNIGSETAKALEVAYDFTQNLWTTAYSKGGINDTVAAAIESSKNTNNVIKTDVGNYCSISLSNLTKSFLTYFVRSMEGYDTGLTVDENSAKNSNYITKNLDYMYTIQNTNEGAIGSDQDMLVADFYNLLYNQICMNGACTDAVKRDQVSDISYLNNALKNGQLFVSTLNNDGYFYQGHYTATSHIAEVVDEAALAQAEAEYNLTKSKLNTKEQTLDVQLKNIDTELSALSTEYDSVKNLISKNVEKVFTMFST